jgi:putative MATE family efflux protein
VQHAAFTYLRISALGLPFVFITLVGHGIMRGHNNLRKPLLIVLCANIANVVAEIVAVYGLKLGIAGSAWSTVLVQVGAAGAFVLILRPHLARVRPAWQRIKPFLVIGSHLGLRSIAMLAVWITVTRVAAHVDTPTLAAHQVLFQLFTFLALILDALAIPAQSLVAGAMGALDRDEAMAIGWSSTKLSIWVGVTFCIGVGVTSGVVPQIFTNDRAVISRVSAGLLFLAVMQIPGAVAFALDGALIGGQDGRFLGRAALGNLVSYVPFLVATLIHPALGIGGLWGGQLAWMTMRAVVNERRFRSQRWMPDVALTI